MKAVYVKEEGMYNVELTAHIRISKVFTEDDAIKKAREAVVENPSKYLNVTYIEKT